MNFLYHIGTHLLRPATITSNITYQPSTTSSPLALTPLVAETSVITSPFDGNAVNLNFFNLAVAVTDLTYQANIFQNYVTSVESTSFGFVSYNGRQELEANFYGGSSFNLSGTTLFTTPYIMDNTAIKAFQMAALNGIIYSSTGAINTGLSLFRQIQFGEISSGSPFSTPTSLTTYMNSKLKFSSNDGTNTFTFTGGTNPITNWGTTFGTISPTSPRSFYMWWNDGYTQYTNGFTFTDGAGFIHTGSSSGPIVGAKCTINYTLGSATIGALAGYIQNVLNVAIGNANTFTVTVNGSNLTLNISNDRTQNGVFQVTFQKDVTGDSGYTLTTGIIEWLGWGFTPIVKATNPETLPANTSEAYDYSSIFTFTPSGVGPYTLNITGANAYSYFSFIDGNGGANTALLGAFGIPTQTTTYYHTRRPLPTYFKTLNYGGPFWATTVNSTGNMTVGGNLTVNGQINFTGAFNPYALPSYIPNSTFSFNTSNGIVIPSWLPYANASASSTPTSGGAVAVYTYTVTYTSNPGGTIFVNGVQVTVSNTLNTSNLIAQYLGTLTQPGYTFSYTGTNTFTIAVTGPYANPTIVNGTLLSTAVSFGVTNTNGVPVNDVTLLGNNTSPLYGTLDAVLTKPAANRLGQGFAVPFTIDRGATGQPFQVLFYYNTSANYLSGDLSVFVYDVANANLIPLSVSAIPSSPQASMFVATFYPSSSLNYRLLLHISSTNSTGWTFEYDMLSVAPQSPYLTVMQAVGPWTSYPLSITGVTANPSKGTITSEVAQWRRVGSNMEILYNLIQTTVGATTGTGDYIFSLPSGYTVDFSKFQTAVGGSLGFTLQGVSHIVTTTPAEFIGEVEVLPTTPGGVFLEINSASGVTQHISSTYSALNTITEIHFACTVPIAQWSAQTNLATDYTEYASNTDQTSSSNSSAFYNGKDGAGFPVALSGNITKTIQFNRPVQVTDKIEIEVYDLVFGQWFPLTQNRNGSLAFIVQNGINYGLYLTPVSSTQFNVNFSQYARPTGVTFGSAGEVWTNYNTGSNNLSKWRVRKISNGNTAEQLPVIRAEYTEASGASMEGATFPTQTAIQMNFSNKIEDTNSAVTTGSSWKFTVPVAGTYAIRLFIESASASFNNNDSMTFDLYVNGVASKRIAAFRTGVASTSNYPIDISNASVQRYFNTGDYFDVRVAWTLNNGSHPTTWSTDATFAICPRISIMRVGN
jgi:hypothetical protein